MIRVHLPDMPPVKSFDKHRADIRESVIRELKVSFVEADGDPKAAVRVSLHAILERLIQDSVADGFLKAPEEMGDEKYMVRFGGDGSKGVVALTVTLVSGECGKHAQRPCNTHTILLTRKDENYATLSSLMPLIKNEMEQISAEGILGGNIEFVFCSDLKFCYAMFGHLAANAADFCLFWFVIS